MTRMMQPLRKGLRILRRAPHQYQPASPRIERRDCQGQLIAALTDLIGAQASIGDASMRPWCSATFMGAQHRIALRLSGPDAARQAEALAAHLLDVEFRLRGHIVADVAIDAQRAGADGEALIDLAILTIEDW